MASLNFERVWSYLIKWYTILFSLELKHVMWPRTVKCAVTHSVHVLQFYLFSLSLGQMEKRRKGTWLRPTGQEGVTPSVGSHSFRWFSDAARPTRSTHPPNCIPAAPPSTVPTESHTRKYVPPTSGAGVQCDVTLQFFSGSTGWQWQVTAYTRWAVTHNGGRSKCVYVSAFVYVFVCMRMCVWVGFAPDG